AADDNPITTEGSGGGECQVESVDVTIAWEGVDEDFVGASRQVTRERLRAKVRIATNLIALVVEDHQIGVARGPTIEDTVDQYIIGEGDRVDGVITVGQHPAHRIGDGVPTSKGAQVGAHRADGRLGGVAVVTEFTGAGHRATIATS